jgi:hypothetical protein
MPKTLFIPEYVELSAAIFLHYINITHFDFSRKKWMLTRMIANY